MSNIRDGKTIYSNNKDYRLMLHNDGHLASWNRNYFDGQALPTWRSSDHGPVEEAAQCFPGLRAEIDSARK